MNLKMKLWSLIVIIAILTGCMGQAPAPKSTEAPPATTITAAPTIIPPTTAPLTTLPPTTPPPKEYIQIMADLEKNFPQLASELKELPELKDGISDSDLEALNDIYYLLKNATNPEVKEAFDLMIKGGNPGKVEREIIEKMIEITKNIKIDGKIEDWKNTKPIFIDSRGDSTIKSCDIKNIYAFLDDKFLFVAFEFWEKPKVSQNHDFAVHITSGNDYHFGIDSYQDKTEIYKFVGDESKFVDSGDFYKMDEIFEVKIPLKLIENPKRLDFFGGVWLLKERNFTDRFDGGSIGLDFSYELPDYNTELQVLFWLAQTNEFTDSDTLAQAIAMTHGFYVTIGDNQVRKAIKKDASDLLIFFREVNSWQIENEFFPLENYPLEAKIALIWRGNDTATHGTHALSGSQGLTNYKMKKFDLKGYRWNNVEVETLKKMREILFKKKFMTKNPEQLARYLDDYFFFGKYWKYNASRDKKIDIYGELVIWRNYNNADFMLNQYIKEGFAQGVCDDWAAFQDAWMKAAGFATIDQFHYWKTEGEEYNGHTFITFFDPFSGTWKAQERHLDMGPSEIDAYIFRPPIYQIGYLSSKKDTNKALVTSPFQTGEVNNSYFGLFDTTTDKVKELFTKGVPTSQMKQWLLYSSPI